MKSADGDWTAGRLAWRLAEIRRLEPPVPALGARGLWHPSESLRALVAERAP